MLLFGMHVIYYTTILGWLLVPTLGWLPGEDKEVRAVDGSSLFNPSLLQSSVNRRSIALPSNKIRGVNLGSLFVFEPWLAMPAWEKMGCGTTAAELDCVSKLGQSRANASFADHWNTWINQSDIKTMLSYGLNTIRIPGNYFCWR